MAEAAESDCPPSPPPRPGGGFLASLSIGNGTLECPPQEARHPYRDLPGGFSNLLQDALFLPWIIGRGSMTACAAGKVGEEWARKWGQWCAATHAPGTPFEGLGPHTRPRPTMIRGAGPDHPWDAAAGGWLQATPGPHAGWNGDVSSLIRALLPPPPRTPRCQRAPSYGDTHIGV